MNKGLFLPISLFVIGIIFLGYGILIDEVQVGLIVFIPFVISSGVFGFLGISCIFLSMISLFFVLSKLSWDQSQRETQSRDYETEMMRPSSEKKVQTGGVIFIGPIPIIFGSNKKITRYMIIVSIIIFILIIIYASLLLNE